ncbi:MAG TPA: hypothetical protein VFA68_21845 [Terriglobales bacterium]|nr:hypothetical protein [Terriglobales bacterium]
MKTKMSSLMLCLVLGLLSACVAFAQEQTSDQSKSDVRTITGCVSKGDSADEFLLTGEDGSTWEVRSSAVSLVNHVGHKVTATGVVSNPTMHNLKEDAKDAAHDAHMKKSETEHGHMKITDVQMVSESCK